MAYDELTAKLVSEAATLRAEIERQRALFNDMCGTAKRALKDLGKANERLRAALQDVVEAWDWWQVDTSDRCASVPADAIEDARLALAQEKQDV